MKKWILLGALCTPWLAYAQPNPEAYTQNLHQDTLKYHLSAIASDEFEGRNTGARGERLTVAYMREFFSKHGINPPANLPYYTQNFLLKTFKQEKASLTINNQTLLEGTDYIIPITDNKSNSFSTEDLVYVGYGIQEKSYNDYKGLNVKGKTVVFCLGEPKDASGNHVLSKSTKSIWSGPEELNYKLNLAKKNGAVGAIVIIPKANQFNAFHKRLSESRLYMDNAPAPKEMNYAYMPLASAKNVFGSLSEQLDKTVKLELLESKDRMRLNQPVEFEYKRNLVSVPTQNIAAIIEGTDKKDEYVVVSAHYDHVGIINNEIYNGADDDGSGTVAIMEIARSFAEAKKKGHGPRRSVIILAFTAEEKGLLGSRYFSEYPFIPLDKVSANINIDMIGRVDTERNLPDTNNYVYVVGHDKISSDLQPVSEGVNQKYTQLVFDYKYDHPDDPNRIYFRSDHYHFARKGVPVLFFYDGMLKADYHKPTDTYEKINFPLYEKRAKYIFYLLWEIANKDEMLIRDRPIPTATR